MIFNRTKPIVRLIIFLLSESKRGFTDTLKANLGETLNRIFEMRTHPFILT